MSAAISPSAAFRPPYMITSTSTYYGLRADVGGEVRTIGAVYKLRSAPAEHVQAQAVLFRESFALAQALADLIDACNRQAIGSREAALNYPGPGIERGLIVLSRLDPSRTFRSRNL